MELEKEAVARAFKRHGGVLPDAPDGPILPGFDPRALAEAICEEIERCGLMGWPRISLHMDVLDAAQLMQFLRRG